MPKRKVVIKENAGIAKLAAYLLRAKKGSHVAITIGRVIYLNNEEATQRLLNDKRWLAHELAHVRQFERYGLAWFSLLYLWACFRYGYYNCPYEIEARNQEQDVAIIDNYIFESAT